MKTRTGFLATILLLAGCSVYGPVTPYAYDNGPDYLSEGLMRVQDSRGRIGFADARGRVVIPPQFAFAFPFKNGQARVTMQGKRREVQGGNGEIHVWDSKQWFCIDKTGRCVKCASGS